MFVFVSPQGQDHSGYTRPALPTSQSPTSQSPSQPTDQSSGQTSSQTSLWDKTTPERIVDADSEAAIGRENYKKQLAELAAGAPLKGTTFFGGAGMNGPYIDDMVNALKGAGITNVRAADSNKWSMGSEFIDAPLVPFNNHRDMRISDLSEFGTEGEQFNLIGYSHGAVQAAQAAADYADAGGTVDNLVLMGAPINQTFLDNLESNPNIKSVQVIDLAEQNDPVYAGMSDLELIDRCGT